MRRVCLQGWPHGPTECGWQGGETDVCDCGCSAYAERCPAAEAHARELLRPPRGQRKVVWWPGIGWFHTYRVEKRSDWIPCPRCGGPVLVGTFCGTCPP